VNKRTVYGGGGIMPDVFVPLDTTIYTDYYKAMSRKGIIYQYVVEYIDAHRTELSQKYPDFNTFNQNFEVDTSMYQAIKNRAETKKITPKDEAEFENTKSEMSLLIKSLLARDLWNTNEFYMVLNSADETLKQAVQIVTDKKAYQNRLNAK